MAILICRGILEMADLVEGGGQDSPGEAVVYFVKSKVIMLRNAPRLRRIRN
jgi:hypothetical protein